MNADSRISAIRAELRERAEAIVSEIEALGPDGDDAVIEAKLRELADCGLDGAVDLAQLVAEMIG